MLILLFAFGLQVSCADGERVNSSEDLSVSLTSSQLIDYTSVLAQIRLIGVTSSDYLNLDLLTVHTDNLCQTVSVGQATVAQFNSSGILVQIPVNVPTDFYVKSQALNTCTLLLENFSHDPLVPGEPIFTAISPQSPSRFTTAPGLFGQALPLSSTVEFFSDAICTQALASGSASNFAQSGIAVQLPLNQTTSIYARTRDPIGTLSGCVYMTDFTHSNVNSPFPELLAITPLSPSKASFAPNIRGTTSVGSVTVSLYTDSGCMNLLVSGDPSDFETAGFDVTLPENATTVIYARSVDGMGAPSVCALFTTYTHDNLPPAALGYLGASPMSPTNQKTLPRIFGSASSDTDEIIFYDSALCLNTIGFGNRPDFIGIGAVTNVRSNDTTNIYARAFDSSDNGSDCTFLTSYIHNTTPPENPVFNRTDPLSPTNLTTTPLIIGQAAARTVNLFFYKDELCTVSVGQGDIDDYEVNGILLNLDTNSTTPIYVRVSDLEGNMSDCTFHASYEHSSVPAPNPTFAFTVPASPSRFSSTPAILGTADPTIETIRIFTNPTCTTQIASASRGQYTASGVVANLPLNSTTQLFARAVDIYGNFSACVFLTTYIHNNVSPVNPTYSGIAPISPNNQSSTPTISGDVLDNPASQLPPSRVEFFDSDSCVTKLGEGTPNQFNATGITIDVNINAETSIYAKAFDAAGNESNCTLLTFYTYNILVPAAPVFQSTTPTSPSYNQEIRLFGSYTLSPDFMNRVNLSIYANSICTSLVTSANPTLLTTTGVPIQVNPNATMALYGQTINEVGTLSACRFLTNFTHNNLPPANLVASNNVNGSVNLSWLPDGLANPTPRYTVERSNQSGGPYTVLSSQQIGNNYNDLQITDGETYYYRVFASNVTGRSQSSPEVSITIAAPTPIASNNLVTTVGDSRVNLTWSGFPENVTYRIFRSLQFAGPFTDLGVTTTSTFYADTGLSNGQTYFYLIKASNPAGESSQSNIASAVPKANPSAPTLLSITPLNAIASCGGGQGLKINWSRSSYYDTFNVYKGFPKNSLGLMGSTDLASFDDCGFGNDNINYIRVRAGWGLSESGGSNIVGFYSSDSPQLNLAPGDGEVILSWTAPSTFGSYNSGDLFYTVYKSSDPDKNFSVLVDGYTPRSLVDPTANMDGAYYYVQAYLFDIDGDKIYVGYPTAIKAARANVNPSAPGNLILNFIAADNRVQLDWISPSHFNNFRLYRSANELGPFTFVQNINTTFMSSAPLLTGMNFFRITAVWGSHETAPTNTVGFRNAPITGFAMAPQSDRLQLSWNAVAGAQDYVIARANSFDGPFVNYDVASTATYQDTAVNVNTGYYYRVRARFSDLTEGQSSQVVLGQITTSTLPSNISLTVLGDTFMRVDWPSVPATTSYRVERALNIAGPYTIATTTATNTATIFGLNPQSLYYIRVVAIVAGVPQTSPVAQAWTFMPASAPSGITGNNQVTLSWTPMAGAIDYDIERSTDGSTFSAISTNYAMTNFTDNTASNGNVYFYRIKTNYPPLQLLSPISVGFSPGRIPLSPVQLHAENTGSGNDVNLTWTDVSGRTSFNIYRSTTSGVYGAPIQNTTSSSGTIVSGLVAGTTYYFRVTALNGFNESAPSNEVMIQSEMSTPKPDVQFNTTTSIGISWASVVNANTYNLYRSTNAVNFELIASGLPTTSYVDASIAPAQTYYYQYQAIAINGSEMATSLISDPVNVSIRPQTPVGLNLASQSTNSVELYWPNVPSIASYELLRSVNSGGPYSVIATLPPATTEYLDTTVIPGDSYFYVLRTVNSSGVISNNSNQVSVLLVSGPTNLTAVNGTSAVELNWDVIPSVTQYEVLRSESSSGPYGVVQTSVTTSALDSNVVAAVTYYYAVRGVYANGRRSVSSNTVSIIRDGSLRFQVPIELTDLAIASSGSNNIAFNRTLTTFDTNDYDGVTGLEFEVIGTNFDTTARSVGIVNESDVMMDFITIPANTFEPTVFKSPITINSGAQKLRLELEQTTSDGQLSVYSAKLLVNQVNATKTKIYYPLLSSDESPINVDADVFAYSTSDTVYHDFPQASLFTRRALSLDKIIEYNAWELETLISTVNGAEGILGLYNNNTSQLVAMTETRFSGPGVIITSIPFNEGVLQFRGVNEGHNYRLVLRCEYYCSTGSVRIHKAGLWVKLRNLSKTSLVYRIGSLNRMIGVETILTYQRAIFDRSQFTNPKVYYQVTADTDSLSQGSVDLMYHSASSGNLGLNLVTGSQIFINPATLNNYRSPEIVGLPINEKFVSRVSPSQGQITIRSSQILVESGP